MSKEKRIRIWTDGGARGNPGPAGIGAVLKDAAGDVLAEVSAYVGETTNNQAEYLALRSALERAQQLGATHLDIYMDSKLIVEQMNRRYRVKDAALQKRFLEVWNLSQGFTAVRFTHIPREQNSHADALVNAAIDRRQAGE